MDSGTSVKVAVRIRPLSAEESAEDQTLCINAVVGEPQIIAGTDGFFTFDHVFGVDSTQSQIYDECVADLVNAAFEGFNATILAYGQTGSGKTWTMGSASSSEMRLGGDNFGIIPRVIESLFEIMEQKELDDPNSTYKIQVQFLEIYGENIRDLLDPTRTSKVSIRETAAGEVFVSGAREEFVSSASQMMKTLEDGTKHRTTASTLMNLTSSRSHAIFTVFLERTIHTSVVLDMANSNNHNYERNNEDNSNDSCLLEIKTDEDNSETEIQLDNDEPKINHSKEIRRCKFHFVDLAGSERMKRTGTQGQQMKEGIDINKGLLALGNVISALGDEQRKGKVHVPYRVSKLTRMLQDSLGGNSKTLMICCVSPSGVNFYESLNALRYANRARNIKNKPIINRDATLVMIDELRKLIQILASELVAIRRNPSLVLPECSLPLHELELLLLNGNMSRSRLLSPNGNANANMNMMTDGRSSPSPSTFQIKGKKRNMSIMPSDSNFYQNSGGNGNGNSSGSVRSNSITSGTYGGTFSGPCTPNSSTIIQNQNNLLSNFSMGSNVNNTTLNSNSSNNNNTSGSQSSNEKKELIHEIFKLKNRVIESDLEVKRLTEQTKKARLHTSEVSERSILMQSERDYYHMKWSDACPLEAKLMMNSEKSTAVHAVDDIAINEKNSKDRVTGVVAGYLREIEILKSRIAKQNITINTPRDNSEYFFERDIDLESELTSNVSKVIAETEKYLSMEVKRLKNGSSKLNLSVSGENTLLDMNNDSEDSGDLNHPMSGSSSPTDMNISSGLPISQIELTDQAYQRRQKIMTNEVADVEESIELKEQLLGQLKRSHYQYSVMKTFYEQKLIALELEMAEKQEERNRLTIELNKLEHNTEKNEFEAIKQKSEQEALIRLLLHKKDDELRLLKKKQEELSGLSKVQSRYMTQVAKLETDIDCLKKQKVDLFKSLQGEKKKHFVLLNEKARDIDKLKRELAQSTGTARRLSKEKIRAEDRAKDALRDAAAMKRKISDAQKHGNTSESGASKARIARRAMGGASKTSATRILTEDELKTKKWLDRKIADINRREEAADTLRKQCEQQLALINRKEALEQEKSSMEKSMRDVITGTSSCDNLIGYANGNGTERELSKEETEALQEIEDRLESVEGQLKLKGRNILEIESKLSGCDVTSAQENTVEALKRISAVSLPASHELIRLLFDMLVSSKSSSQQRKSSLTRSEARERQLRHDLDDASSRITTLMRAHDMELTRSANEYEVKLLGLFTHSTIGKLVIQECGAGPESPSVKKSPPHSPAASIGRYRNSAEASYKMLLSVATEQSNLLRSRLERESVRTIELQSRLNEADHACVNLHRALEDKDINIKFLEDERTLFRDLADRLRAGISTLGGEAGSTILKQIKDRVPGAIASDESDEETESMLGEYTHLGDIINRTGNVTEKNTYYEPLKYARSLSSSAPAVMSQSESPVNKTIVYDRLTNPSNFTGAMKNAFGQDLIEKREKVQQFKSGQSPRKNNISGFSSLSSRAHHNKEHIVAYLDGTLGNSVTDKAEKGGRNESITTVGSNANISNGNSRVSDNESDAVAQNNPFGGVRMSPTNVNINRDAAFSRTTKVSVRTASPVLKGEVSVTSIGSRGNGQKELRKGGDEGESRRSISDSFPNASRPACLDLINSSAYPIRSRSVMVGSNTGAESDNQNEIMSESELELQQLTTPVRSENVNGILRKIRKRNKGEGTDTYNSSNRRESAKSAYSDIVEDDCHKEETVRALNRYESHEGIDESDKERKESRRQNSEYDGYEEEEDEASEASSHYSVTSVSTTSVNSRGQSVNTNNSNKTGTTPAINSREEMHLMKMKSRLQSATSSPRANPSQATLGRRSVTSSSLKSVQNLNKS